MTNIDYYKYVIFMVVFVGILAILAIIFVPDQNKISSNDLTLNQYAAFESTCSYRGYDRDECLMIWSGR